MDLDTVGSFLEFLYTGEYFPKKLPGQRVLESDPSLPAVDDTGVHLLKHARLYTLAEKFGMKNLRTLASSKIHCVNSTAKGEITYARYVYANTGNDDKTVRAPIASFWATRSHTLRAEAEDEFKALCLEYPQFGYDVLSTAAPFLLGCRWRHVVSVANGSQRGSSTTSSSASATRRCTRRRGAVGRGRGTAAAAAAMREQLVWSVCILHLQQQAWILELYNKNTFATFCSAGDSDGFQLSSCEQEWVGVTISRGGLVAMTLVASWAIHCAVKAAVAS